MKKILIIISFIAISLSFPSQLSAQEGIDFIQKLSWEQILQKAKKENKYIFVDAFATWCGPCKQMDQEVYTDKSIGDFYNQNFVAVKVQMDSSKNDNANVKAFYKDAQRLMVNYKVQAFPTYLYFSPEGLLVHKDVGFQDTNKFLQTGKAALDPKRQIYATISAYRTGEKNYDKMLDILKFARLAKNVGLVDSITKDYLSFLNTRQDKEILTKDNLLFYRSNAKYLSSNNRIFKLAYENGDLLDSIVYEKGWSSNFLGRIIFLEEIDPVLWNNDKPIVSDPEWNQIIKTIKSKYPSFDPIAIVLNTKINFYRRTENWRKYVETRNDLIRTYLPINDPLIVYSQLNAPAWDVFLYCNEKSSLKQALKWSDLSIKLTPSTDGNLQNFDTRANLLYKLGRKKEALKQEEIALDLVEKLKIKAFEIEYAKNLEKMKKDLPTWPIKK